MVVLHEVCVWCASGLIYGYMFSGYAFVLDCGIETVYNFIVRGVRVRRHLVDIVGCCELLKYTMTYSWYISTVCSDYSSREG